MHSTYELHDEWFDSHFFLLVSFVFHSTRLASHSTLTFVTNVGIETMSPYKLMSAPAPAPGNKKKITLKSSKRKCCAVGHHICIAWHWHHGQQQQQQHHHPAPASSRWRCICIQFRMCHLLRFNFHFPFRLRVFPMRWHHAIHQCHRINTSTK